MSASSVWAPENARLRMRSHGGRDDRTYVTATSVPSSWCLAWQRLFFFTSILISTVVRGGYETSVLQRRPLLLDRSRTS